MLDIWQPAFKKAIMPGETQNKKWKKANTYLTDVTDE